ncbi:pentatricopeptide repeat-containing protein At2g20710, mitochondrial-like isoform X3 [Euphorbia lathyris]|uniref:pentatricopeptide repeat-containing protein At2g20710, mitochondrial-like isoform X3 n=1 Tax=Euphorbia lathyris TaxID=212925 RepID=UPI003313AC25
MNLLVKPNSYPWNRCYRLLKALLASPNPLISSFSSSSSSPQIDFLESTKSKVEDQSLSTVSIIDEFLQSGKKIKRCKLRKSSSAPIGPLTRRILSARDPSLSMFSILDQWSENGLEVKLSELHNVAKKLRQRCRFSHALQILEWMSDKRGSDLSAEHFAVRLDLISKVHGLEEAEKYFNGISDTSKGYQVYVVLLICYGNAKQLEKAETLMQTMRDMGIILTAYAYNVMLNLYSKMGKYEKLDLLAEEMEEKGIKHDVFTFEIRLHAYGASGDIEGMEKLLTKINTDPELELSFRAYCFAAYGYLKAGHIDNAMIILKASERLAKRNLRRYEKLLNLYAATGNKAEVYRVWDLYKQKMRYSNTGYMSMISSLVKLDDMDGAEKIWEEWNSAEMKFDIQIPNLMITAYSRKGFWEKAEEYINKIIKRGKEPDGASWNGVATGYLLGGRMLEAVETMKKAISMSKPGWSPRLHSLAAYLKYLEGEGDKEAAEELWKMINEHCHLSTDEYNRLSSLVNDEKLTSNAVGLQMEDDQMCVEPPTALEFSDKRSKVAD